MAEPADSGGRGSLLVHDRVVERIAEHLAAGVPGVARLGGRLERAVGRRYPKVDAEIAGARVRVGVEVAVRWPASLPDTTAAVRAAVAAGVTDLAGLRVDAVDVVARVVPPETTEERRVL